MRLAAILLRCPDPRATAAFYVRAFGCQVAAAPGGLLLHLGAQRLLLCPAGTAARRDFAGCEAGFQHCAIVVPAMPEAMRRLAAVAGWSAISRDGPQRLPAASGGVTAFKFRDPDGHPLELLHFPPGAVPPAWRGATAPFAGIDHSAISVTDTARAVAFYTGLGFTPGPTRRNHGAAQARLDALDGAVVEVTPLHPPGGGPHLELLRYRHPPPRPDRAPEGSTAATALLLHGAPGGMMVDPDGHRLLFDEGESPVPEEKRRGDFAG